MPAHRAGNEDDSPIAFGQRLHLLRSRRGMTRETLGGLVGRTGSWVKALETGRLQVPKLHLLLALAEALRVRDLAELTGEQSMPVQLFVWPGHARLPEVRAAIDLFPLPLPGPGTPVASVEQLRQRLDHAWAARHAAARHREVIGALLPGLIRDA